MAFCFCMWNEAPEGFRAVSETERGAKPTSFARLTITGFNIEVAARG
jgi:hypothetical protein